VEELCGKNAGPGDQIEDEWGALLAGQAIVEIGSGGPVSASNLGKKERVRQWQVQLLASKRLPAIERASAGDTLARLGDPRFDDKHWYLPGEPLFGFKYIPAGGFVMGTKPGDVAGLVKKYGGDKEWFERETPQHTVYLPAYWMAKFPVTVAQFKAFVDDKKYKPVSDTSLLGLPTHPVVDVSWYDALEYCTWLTGRLQRMAGKQKSEDEQESVFWEELANGTLVVTLPSEAEWEKAARSTDGREFPWDGEFTPDRANVEMNIGRTSAVGCFPKGESPYGLLDISGNVWEWTRSIYNTYPYDPTDGRESLKAVKERSRVLRGGAFHFNHRLARCAFRHWRNPGSWRRSLGFRVVVGASPISGS